MLLFLYIPQFLARYREYVGEIYELEYYLIFFFFLPFPFLFSFFFYLHFTLYQLPPMGPICHFIKIYSYEILF
jgi:hypothetical protein